MLTKQWILAFTFLVSAGGLVHAQPLANSDYYLSHGIATLIGELGSSTYAKRESAHKTIEVFGPMALEQLRRFRGRGNTEAKRRIEDLIRRAEELQITQQILAPKEMSLKLKNALVHEAITELAEKGYPIQFQGDATQFANKRVTLEGKMTFWQALDKLCEQAWLKERVDFADSLNPYTRVGSPYGTTRPHGPLVLHNRGSQKSIVSHAGAIKTEMRISRDKDSKELAVMFVISAEPRLLQHTLVGDVVVDNCTTSDGALFQLLHGPTKSKGNAGDELFREAERERIASFNAMDPSMAFRRTAQIRLKGADAKQIKELAGKLTMQVDVQNETLARIDKVLDSAGKSVDGAGGGRMTVQSIKKLPNGNYEAKISLENIGSNPMDGKIAFNGKGGVVIRGNVIINGGGMVIGPNGVRMSGGGGGNPRDYPDLIDAKGQKFKNLGVFDDEFHVINNSSSRTGRIIYQATAAQTEPSALVLLGTRTYTIAVPFRFENVPLP